MIICNNLDNSNSRHLCLLSVFYELPCNKQFVGQLHGIPPAGKFYFLIAVRIKFNTFL